MLDYVFTHTWVKHEYLNKVNRLLVLFAFSISLDFSSMERRTHSNYQSYSIFSCSVLQHGFKSAHMNCERNPLIQDINQCLIRNFERATHKWNETTHHQRYTAILNRMYRCGKWKLKLVSKVFDSMRSIDLAYDLSQLTAANFKPKLFSPNPFKWNFMLFSPLFCSHTRILITIALFHTLPFSHILNRLAIHLPWIFQIKNWMRQK